MTTPSTDAATDTTPEAVMPDADAAPAFDTSSYARGAHAVKHLDAPTPQREGHGKGGGKGKGSR